jgi:hypothetical protein
MGTRISFRKFESPLKRKLLYGGLDGAKYIKNSRESFSVLPFFKPHTQKKSSMNQKKGNPKRKKRMTFSPFRFCSFFPLLCFRVTPKGRLDKVLRRRSTGLLQRKKKRLIGLDFTIFFCYYGGFFR